MRSRDTAEVQDRINQTWRGEVRGRRRGSDVGRKVRHLGWTAEEAGALVEEEEPKTERNMEDAAELELRERRLGAGVNRHWRRREALREGVESGRRLKNGGRGC